MWMLLLIPSLLWSGPQQLQATASSPTGVNHKGGISVVVRNYFGTSYLSGIRVILVSSSGQRDSVVSNKKGVALFSHVDAGRAVLWQSDCDRCRDTVEVIGGHVVQDTLMGLPKRRPPELYR
jgi:hypothetical protein